MLHLSEWGSNLRIYSNKVRNKKYLRMNASCIKDLAMISNSNVSVINILPPPYLGFSGMNSIYRKRKKGRGRLYL